MQINPAGGLSKEEIERLIEEGKRFAQADAQKRELRRLRNRLEGLLVSNERVYQQLRRSLNEKDQKRIGEALLRARTALGSELRADLEAALFDLNSVSRLLSEAMLAGSEKPGASTTAEAALDALSASMEGDAKS
jgi:molecular chaperone DnaK